MIGPTSRALFGVTNRALMAKLIYAGSPASSLTLAALGALEGDMVVSAGGGSPATVNGWTTLVTSGGRSASVAFLRAADLAGKFNGSNVSIYRYVKSLVQVGNYSSIGNVTADRQVASFKKHPRHNGILVTANQSSSGSLTMKSPAGFSQRFNIAGTGYYIVGWDMLSVSNPAYVDNTPIIITQHSYDSAATCWEMRG